MHLPLQLQVLELKRHIFNERLGQTERSLYAYLFSMSEFLWVLHGYPGRAIQGFPRNAWRTRFGLLIQTGKAIFPVKIMCVFGNPPSNLVCFAVFLNVFPQITVPQIFRSWLPSVSGSLSSSFELLFPPNLCFAVCTLVWVYLFIRVYIDALCLVMVLLASPPSLAPPTSFEIQNIFEPML